MQTAIAKTTEVKKPLSQLTTQLTHWRVLIVAVLGGTIAAGGLLYSLSRFAAPQKSALAIPVNMTAKTVTALGRLEPQGEVIQLAASSKGSRVEQLLVKRGDRVQPGQVIAVLDSHDRLQATVRESEAGCADCVDEAGTSESGG